VARLFLPQSTLEEWALADKADLKEGKLSVPGESASYPAAPAVHFVRVVSGVDEKKLAQKVKTQEHLHAMGAEQMADSVILGETAYEVVTGYVTDVPTPGKAQPQKANAETDLLAAFILNKL